ncbi:hypothetical protein BCR44DRAFT_1502870 [Catenaria anguillulae PL171]|uniref:Uncharacterized protein n=1 Tax=Catenaria anguillulae PL171 TaxID=765915 RepID=A0A1Y2HCF6_9FUNG|nr:hypothetical protein BCR44DRAFT_1502870 [Catenaria anguillulae PL171]
MTSRQAPLAAFCAATPGPPKAQRVDEGPLPPQLTTNDDDELFMDDDDDIFLDPQALAILTQADAQAQSSIANTASAAPSQDTRHPPCGPTPAPTQHITMSLPPGKQPIAGRPHRCSLAFVAVTGNGPAGSASAAAVTAAAPSSDDPTLRAEIARLEAQLQTRVGEAAMLRQKLATAQAEQRKAEQDKREFEERVRSETEAKMASMMQELQQGQVGNDIPGANDSRVAAPDGRIQFSQATTTAVAPASPMRSPAVLRSAVSASGLGRMGLMRPPSMHMQVPMGPPPKFGGSQFPTFGHIGPGASSALVNEVAEPMVSSEDRMDVDGLDAPTTAPPPPPVTAEHVHRPSSHIHTLLQLVPTLHAPPELCANLLTSLTSPPPTSAAALLPPLVQVLTHITPHLRSAATEPIVNTALTTAHLAHWLARHSTAEPPSSHAPRLVPAILDTICAAATFHFRATYPPAATATTPKPTRASPRPTWPSTLIPLLFSTLDLLFTRPPTPTPSLLALPSSAYLTALEPEYLAHARDWPAPVHLALARWARVVFAYADPGPMLAHAPAGRSLLSVLVKLAHRSPDLKVVRGVLGAVHVLAARWPAKVAGRWAWEEGVGVVVERVHREAHLLVYGARQQEGVSEWERVEAVRNGLCIVYVLVVYCARADAAVRLDQLIAPGGGEAGGVAGVWTQTRLMATLANVRRWVAAEREPGAMFDEHRPRSLRQRVEARRQKEENTRMPAKTFDLEMIAELEAAVGAVVVPGSTQTQQSLTQVTVTQVYLLTSMYSGLLA